MKNSTKPQQSKKVVTPATKGSKPQKEMSSEPVKEKIDPKKLIIYSEIMSPKFKN